jgi:tRNA nucleotidyltransferase (CCA-adding enzyme)
MDPSSEQLSALVAARESVPAALLGALDGAGAYLVGGAVRDALDGRLPEELDIAVEQEVDELLARLGVEATSHARFGTATVELDGQRIDLAQTRREHYPRPGALPEVAPAPIRADLARRDFSVNAMALPLQGEVELLDPCAGLADLEARRLRAIHPDSFRDDPTRALRAARYCVRLDLRPEPATARQLREADLSTVSQDRVGAELRRLASGPQAIAGFGLLDEWGVLPLGPERLELLERVAELAQADPWSSLIEAAEALLEAATCPAARLEAAQALAELDPAEPASALFEAAAGLDEGLLMLARALGAGWLDQHVSEWRSLSLSIDGEDLIAAGIEQGPEVGIGLRAVRAARIDGRVPADRERELQAALAAIHAAR